MFRRKGGDGMLRRKITYEWNNEVEDLFNEVDEQRKFVRITRRCRR
jgi:hypothetical protein